VASLALAASASGHRDPELGLEREIDQLIADTNALRRDIDKPPYRADRSYRELADEEALLEVYRLWQRRFDAALKKSHWWELALCESGGDWAMRNEYHGGLSFHPETWAAYRLKGMPKYAFLATPAEQVRVARLVLADQGWEAWPACARKLGLL
jgi:hypothetical protein